MASLSLVFDILARDNASRAFKSVGDEAERTGRKLGTTADQFIEFDKAAARLGKTLGGIGKFAKLSFGALGTQAAVGGLTALTGAAAGAAGAVALLPAAAAAAGGPIAALAVGLYGVSDAFKAVTKFSAASARDSAAGALAQRAAAKQIESAQRGVASALESAEDAQRGVIDAQRRVVDAERDVADAQRSSRRAQEDLNEARQEAVRDLTQMNRELASASLDEEDAVLGVERARLRLNESMKAGSEATSLERREADLSYRQSVQSLKDIRARNAELRQDVAKANREGVEGSDRVRSARDQVADAARGEADAARGLQEAQRGVVEAQEAVADAQRDVAAAQRDLRDATQAAAASMAEQSSAAADLSAAMAKLAPSAREFVNQMRGLGPAFTRLRLDVQQRLFAGIGDQVAALAGTYLPILRSGLSGLATDLNAVAKQILGVFSRPQSSADVTTILNNVRDSFQRASAAAAPFVRAMLDLTTVGSTLLPGLATGLANASRRFADAVAQARSTGELRQFMTDSLSTAGQLGSVLGNLGRIIGGVFRAGSDVGGGFLATLERVTAQVAEFINGPGGRAALGKFFASVGRAVEVVLPLLLDLGRIFFGTLAPGLARVAVGLAPLVEALLPLMESVLRAVLPLLVAVADTLGRNADIVLPLVTGLGSLALGVRAIIGVVRTWTAMQVILNAVLKANPLILVATLVAALVAALVVAYNTSDRFRAIVDKAFRVVAAAGKWMWENVLRPAFSALRTAWEAVGTAIRWTWTNIIRPAFDAVKDAVNVVRTAFRTAIDGIVSIWNGLKTMLTRPIQAVIDVVWNNGLRKMWNLVNNIWGGDDLDRVSLARGGVMPGYTPGRDVHTFVSPTGGVLNLSGGEAVMRPEFTRALGVPAINTLNEIARREGEAGLHRALGHGMSQEAYAAGGVRPGLSTSIPGWLSSGTGLFLPGGGGINAALQAAIQRANGANLGGGGLGAGLASMAKSVLARMWAEAKELFSSSMSFEELSGAITANGAGGLGPAAARAHAFVRSNWGFTGTIGGYANRNIAGTNVPSKHSMGKAIDVMTHSNTRLGQIIADFFAGPGRDAFGVDNVIWNRRIHSGRGWSPYYGVSPHTDHPHIDFFRDGGILPQYQRGTNYVPQTGPAILHRGEAVVPAEMNGRPIALDDATIIKLARVMRDGAENVTAEAFGLYDSRFRNN